ncbi:MAG: FtsQ-type POTRA domain-containing protein [Patescibacteria group bacterium]|nr:FtsQ-type POTRA domain-containing protein [Patescibacteria group bacterium]
MVKRRKKNYLNSSSYEGYRKYRTPSIFSGGKIKTEKEFHFPKIPIKMIFIIGIILFLIYYLFFSTKFTIKDVIVEGNKMVPSEKIADSVPKHSNILLFGVSKTKKEILKNNPEIKNVEIFRGLPDAVKIVVLEHEGKLIWQSGDSSYLISTQGYVAKKIDPGEMYDFPRVIDKKNIPVETGANLLSPSFVAFITNIYSQFFNVTNIKPKDFEINQTTFDINLNTEAGFYVKFSSLRSSAKQLDNLKQVLVAKRDQVHEYVDLRIDGWAYYK